VLGTPQLGIKVKVSKLDIEAVGNTKTTERGGGGKLVVYELKQFYTF
jgi:hypothetical protein